MCLPPSSKRVVKVNLSFAKKVGYPILSSNISQAELEEEFSLTSDELKFLENVKQKKNILALAILLKSYQYLHYFPSKIEHVPPQIINHIAKQLNKNPKEIKSYDKLRSLKQYHTKIIRNHLKFNLFEDKRSIIEALIYESCSLISNYNDIVKDCIRNLTVMNIEFPSLSTIQTLVSRALDKANKSNYGYINKSLTKTQKAMIDNAIKETKREKKSEMTLLKLIP